LAIEDQLARIEEVITELKVDVGFIKGRLFEQDSKENRKTNWQSAGVAAIISGIVTIAIFILSKIW
jgi:type IV secretory pathway component VirB8